MENASKALIIAGAILLSILIIGLGMYIYTQASGAMDGANLDSEKANAYNAEFKQYEGTISGSNARALYEKIKAHNRVNTDDISLQISITRATTDFDTNTIAEATATVQDTIGKVSELKAGNTYYVTFQYNKSGYITKCNIRQISS